MLETFGGTGGPAPTFEQEDPEELHKLMLVWDAKSLLRLRPGPVDRRRCSRVFGSFKSPGKFRQIGDRRGQNSYEAKLEGVSHELPQGFLLSRLWVPRFSHQLIGSSTDRKDFYSQSFRLRDFVGTRAFEGYCAWAGGSPPVGLDFSPLPPLLHLGLLCWTWTPRCTVVSLPFFRAMPAEWSWQRQRMLASSSVRVFCLRLRMGGSLRSTLSVERDPGLGSSSTTSFAFPLSLSADRPVPLPIRNGSCAEQSGVMIGRASGDPTTRTFSGLGCLPLPVLSVTPLPQV